MLTGSTGMLGRSLIKTFKNYNICGISREENLELTNQFNFDLSNFKKIKSELIDYEPEIIIHCAANVSLKNCEINKSAAYNLHVNSSKELAKKFPNAKFIYISTDSIFNGLSSQYSEDSEPNPLNYYASTKYFGELEILNNSNFPLIIRTNIIGQNLKKSSFTDWVIKELSQSNTIDGYNNIFFNPIHVDFLSEIILKVVKQNNFPFKILNVGSFNKISKYDYIALLAEKFNFKLNLVNNVSVQNFKDGIERPFNTFLNSERLFNTLKLKYYIKDSIQKIII